MRIFVIVGVVSVLAAFVASAGCKSEPVQGAAECSDPCCSGNPLLVDCSENRNISCVQSGDPCKAQAYGCANGAFFEMAQASLPAGCAAEAGLDAGATEDVNASDDAAEDATLSTDASEDVTPGDADAAEDVTPSADATSAADAQDGGQQ
jgi:hypothetical protein